jgi:nicotinamide-nucleotide amidase
MLAKEIVNFLKSRDLTISTMESCSGGYIISCITNEEGSSSVTEGGFVTYSNNQKIKLGVSESIIKQYGVYSQQTAIEMARATFENIASDVSIGITGTFSNIDSANIDSVQGNVFYSVAMFKDGKLTFVSNKIQVPIMDRVLQKEYIANIIFEKTLEIIKLEYDNI